MKELSVDQESGGRLEMIWRVAGLHPLLDGVGCGTADFSFPTEAERAAAAILAGGAVMDADYDEYLRRRVV